MKIRQGFVSNSSSSSFCIKKSDVDYNELKQFIDSIPCYMIYNDSEDASTWEPIESREMMKDHYYIGTQSSANNFLEHHFKFLKFLDDRKIKDYTDEVGYRGDGRPSNEEEQLALKNGEFSENI